MKKFLDSRFVRDIAVYTGIGTPYYFLMEKLGTDFSGLRGTLIMMGFCACIELTRWGLRK